MPPDKDIHAGIFLTFSPKFYQAQCTGPTGPKKLTNSLRSGFPEVTGTQRDHDMLAKMQDLASEWVQCVSVCVWIPCQKPEALSKNDDMFGKPSKKHGWNRPNSHHTDSEHDSRWNCNSARSATKLHRQETPNSVGIGSQNARYK